MSTSVPRSDAAHADGDGVRRPASLRAVLDAMASGAATVDELADRTSLDPDLVRVALDQLVALGRVTSDRASIACPPAACGGCSAPTGHGCATGGLTTLTLSRRPGC
jgi:hypothetical protein